MILRKLFSVSRKAAAAQRRTIEASFQRVTRRVLRLTPAFGLSTMLVVARQRCNDGGSPSRLMVKHSSRPSRKLAAASGQSPSYHSASFFKRAWPSLACEPPGRADRRFCLILFSLRQPLKDIAQLVRAATLHRGSAKDFAHSRA